MTRCATSLRVSNRGPDTAPAPIVLRDPLPAGLELVSAHGKGWDCTVKKQPDLVVCRRDKDLAAGKSARAVTVVARVADGASRQDREQGQGEGRRRRVAGQQPRHGPGHRG